MAVQNVAQNHLSQRGGYSLRRLGAEEEKGIKDHQRKTIVNGEGKGSNHVIERQRVCSILPRGVCFKVGRIALKTPSRVIMKQGINFERSSYEFLIVFLDIKHNNLV